MFVHANQVSMFIIRVKKIQGKLFHTKPLSLGRRNGGDQLISLLRVYLSKSAYSFELLYYILLVLTNAFIII